MPGYSCLGMSTNAWVVRALGMSTNAWVVRALKVRKD